MNPKIGIVRRVLLYMISFVLGAVVVFVPFYLRGHMLHADEMARGEPTMGPGIVTFFGMLLSPVGGVSGLLAAMWVGRKRRGRQNPEEPE